MYDIERDGFRLNGAPTSVHTIVPNVGAPNVCRSSRDAAHGFGQRNVREDLGCRSGDDPRVARQKGVRCNRGRVKLTRQPCTRTPSSQPPRRGSDSTHARVRARAALRFSGEGHS
jgi:hypothetical protein